MPRSSQQLPVRTSEQLKAPLRQSEHGTTSEASLRTSEPHDEALRQSERDAADLLNEAFKDAKLENKEAAFLCGVSESLVEKWRSKDQRGAPSFVQMLCLPPKFHYALHKQMNKRYGFGKAALRDLMDAAGSLAMVIIE
jgi:hypothetical protein